MFGICLPELLDQDTAPKAVSLDCQINENTDQFDHLQANGRWIESFMMWLREIVKASCNKPNFDWRLNRWTVDHKMMGQIPDQLLRNRLIQFVNEFYLAWKAKYVHIPDTDEVRTAARGNACVNCSQRYLIDHTGRQIPLCTVDCNVLSDYMNGAVRDLYSCNADVLYRLYAQFCQKNGYSSTLPAPSPEFMRLPSDPAFDQTLTPLVTLRQLLIDARKKPA